MIRSAFLERALAISTKTILNQVSFKLREGEILGVAGMVGSGRTELARAIFGADPLTSGTIKIKGHDVFFKNPADAIRNKISLVPEDRKNHGLFTELSILNNDVDSSKFLAVKHEEITTCPTYMFSAD